MVKPDDLGILDDLDLCAPRVLDERQRHHALPDRFEDHHPCCLQLGHLGCQIGERDPDVVSAGAHASTRRVSVEEDELDRSNATGVGPAEVLAVHVLDVPSRACLSGIGGEVDMVVVCGACGLRRRQREGEKDVAAHHQFLLEREEKRVCRL